MMYNPEVIKVPIFDYSKKYVRNIIDERQQKVLRFINDFITNRGKYNETQQEIIRWHFKNGYCWHFAHILQDTFEAGTVCWAAPLGHFVWRDDYIISWEERTSLQYVPDIKCPSMTIHRVYYDIEGIYDKSKTDCKYLIPEKFLTQNMIKEFSHSIPDEQLEPSTIEELRVVMKGYCIAAGIEYDDSLEACNDFNRYKAAQFIKEYCEIKHMIEVVDHEECDG